MASFFDRLLRRDPSALPHTVRVDRALDLLEDGAQLVDVREPAEWKAGHAPQARHIPLARIAGEARRLERDVPVVVMCASGSRSRTAAAQLRSMGYQATSLSGGLAAWRTAGGAVR
ncbi:MAG TPA: rhodanese-like domain-containing protein [Actinotalea sp.]|nr:rhodanese-like domain-containing protein [Actinotalea sp.]